MDMGHGTDREMGQGAKYYRERDGNDIAEMQMGQAYGRERCREIEL